MSSIPLVTDLLAEAVRRFARTAPFDRFIDSDAIAVTASRGRSGPSGKHAECFFTKFGDSRDSMSRDGRWYLPKIVIGGREMKYVINFILPRFMFLSDHERAQTIVHELVHIDRSFDGTGSPLRHGVEFNSIVDSITSRAHADGIRVPPLPQDGQVVYYRKFERMPRALRLDATTERIQYDENRLTIGALRLDSADRLPMPLRYVYECPACRKEYHRRAPLRPSSCSACSRRYDARFKLVLVAPRAEESA
jgi:hypothetical protein